jgi:hypothetical protein
MRISAVGVVFLLPILAHAQISRTTVTSHILDPSGNAVTHAAITLRSIQTSE